MVLSVEATTGISSLETRARSFSPSVSPRAMTASAVAFASTAVPRSVREALAVTSPEMSTLALFARFSIVDTTSSRL